MNSQQANTEYEGVAIIGMSGRFPHARNTREFWENLKNGDEGISYFTPEDAKQAGVSEEEYANKEYIFAGGLLDDIEYFDERLFDFSPREAANMDPQQRLFLECVYETLEDAGYAKDQYDYPVGVYAGANMSTYFLYHLADKLGMKDDFSLAIGNDKDYIATRTSYIFNFKGPSMSVQTACSTSMTAVAMAVEGLENYQCDLALAGGAAIKIPQKMGYPYQQGMIGSPDGHTRPFDADAAGTVFTSVVGVVALKRLEDAMRDGDNIYAVIKGIAVNNDGAAKVGFTAPSREGQADVIASAQYLAGVDLEDIGYIEAHGTGTLLGDPIEISALSKVFDKHTSKRGFCAIGSVKGNIGHAVSGAGIAGLIKTALAIRNKQIPPSINFRLPNPKIDFINSAFYVNTELIPWESDGKPRIAGVSSFGFGGTNVHAVLEEAPRVKQTASPAKPRLISLSAKSPGALHRMRENLYQFLSGNPSIDFADVVYTLHVGRKEFPYRLAGVCNDLNDALVLLSAENSPELLTGEVQEGSVKKSRINADMYVAVGAGNTDALKAMGESWVTGGIIDWPSIYKHENRHRISLPTYPFERNKHWVERQVEVQTKVGLSAFPLSDDPQDWLYSLTWERANGLKFQLPEGAKKEVWLLFMDNLGLGDALASYLDEQGVETIKVYQTASYEKRDECCYGINPGKKTDYQKLMNLFYQTGKKAGGILHLWNVTEIGEDICAADHIDQRLDMSFYSLLFLAQSVGEQKSTGTIKIAVVTNNMHLISNENRTCPEKAAVLGPCRVIPKEYPQMSCQSIDIELAGSSAYFDSAKRIVAEMFADGPEPLVALRGPFRWIQKTDHVKADFQKQESFAKNGATYLITGGLGGLGFEVAKHIASKARVNFILTGRTPLAEDSELLLEDRSHAAKMKARVKELLECGSDVLYMQADCSDAKQMEKVFDTVIARTKKLDGVFHAAGIADNGLIAEKSVETARKVLTPKVKGMLVLHEQIKRIPPEFVVLFSSSSAILGNAGFVDYCAANGFLDAYAQSRCLSDEPYIVSINWDEWDHTGMTEDSTRNRVKNKIPVKSGLAALDWIVSSKMYHQIAVSPGDLLSMISDVRAFLSGSEHQSPLSDNTGKTHTRPELRIVYEAPGNKTEQIIADIWQDLLGIYPVGIHDDYFELGGHSLLATTMVAQFAKVFHQTVLLREIFEKPTVAELATIFMTDDATDDQEEYVEGQF